MIELDLIMFLLRFVLKVIKQQKIKDEI